jgi:hypothetical protein
MQSVLPRAACHLRPKLMLFYLYNPSVTLRPRLEAPTVGCGLIVRKELSLQTVIKHNNFAIAELSALCPASMKIEGYSQNSAMVLVSISRDVPLVLRTVAFLLQDKVSLQNNCGCQSGRAKLRVVEHRTLQSDRGANQIKCPSCGGRDGR